MGIINSVPLLTRNTEKFTFFYDNSKLESFQKYGHCYVIFTAKTTCSNRINYIKKNIEYIINSNIPLIIINKKERKHNNNRFVNNKLLKSINSSLITRVEFTQPTNEYEYGSGESRTASIEFVGTVLYDMFDPDSIIVIGDDRRRLTPLEKEFFKEDKNKNILDLMNEFNNTLSKSENSIICPHPQRFNGKYKMVSNVTDKSFNSIEYRRERENNIQCAQQIYIAKLSTWNKIVSDDLNIFWAPIFQDYPFIHTLFLNNYKITISPICCRQTYTGNSKCESLARVSNRDYKPRTIRELKRICNIVNLKYTNPNNTKISFDIGNYTKKITESDFEAQIKIFKKYDLIKAYSTKRKFEDLSNKHKVKKIRTK